MKLVLTVWFLVFVATIGSVAAGPLDKKQAGALKRLTDDIASQETSLATYGPDQKWQLTQRVQADFERRLQRIAEKLATLPADHPDVKVAAARFAKLQGTLREKVGARDAKAQGAADEKARLTAMLDAPDFAADLEQLRAMVEMFERASWYELDHYHFGRWPDHDDNRAQQAWGAGWVATRARYQALRAKYADVVAAPLFPAPYAARHIEIRELAGRDSDRAFAAFAAAIDAFVAGAEAQIAADGAKLIGYVEEAGKNKAFGAILDPDGRIQAMRWRLINVPAAYAPLAPTPADRDRVAAAARDVETKVDAAIAKVAEKIVATNRAPADAYIGKERAALEAKVKSVWKTRFPGEKIVAIRIRGADFNRTTAWVHDPIQNAFVKKDESRLGAYVLVASGKKEVVMWYVTLSRDHTAGGKLEMSWIERSARGPTPDQRVLVKNLK